MRSIRPKQAGQPSEALLGQTQHDRRMGIAPTCQPSSARRLQHYSVPPQPGPTDSSLTHQPFGNSSTGPDPSDALSICDECGYLSNPWENTLLHCPICQCLNRTSGQLRPRTVHLHPGRLAFHPPEPAKVDEGSHGLCAAFDQLRLPKQKSENSLHSPQGPASDQGHLPALPLVRVRRF
jgi:hypothetical protein